MDNICIKHTILNQLRCFDIIQLNMGIKIAQKHTKISITYEKENILQQERVLISANFLEYIQVKAACFFYVLTPEN